MALASAAACVPARNSNWSFSWLAWVLSRNSADTGLRIFNTIEHFGLKIERAAFTNGESPWKYMDAFGADLLLSTNAGDVRKVAGHRDGLPAFRLDLCGDVPERLLGARDQGQTHSFARKSKGGRSADPATGSADDGPLSLQ